MHFITLLPFISVALVAAAPLELTSSDSSNATHYSMLEARSDNGWIASHYLPNCDTANGHKTRLPKEAQGHFITGGHVATELDRCTPFEPVTDFIGIQWGIRKQRELLLEMYDTADCSGPKKWEVARLGQYAGDGACFLRADHPGLKAVKAKNEIRIR